MAGVLYAKVSGSWVPISTGGGTALAVQDEGAAVASPSILNFVGAGVTATDAGSGRVNVTIPGVTAPQYLSLTNVAYTVTATLSLVPFTTVVLGSGITSDGSGRMVIPADGIYFATVGLEWRQNATAGNPWVVGQIVQRRSGTVVGTTRESAGMGTGANLYGGCALNGNFSCLANDTLEVMVNQQNVTAAVSLEVNRSNFSAHRL